MAKTISVSETTLNHILARLDKLTKDMEAIKAKVFDQEPPYGSDAWWEWSDKKAMEDIKAGRTYSVKNKKELKALLDSWK